MTNNNNGASIVALPSVSSSLHALPHATSIHNVNIHQHMYANRAAESQAKLQKALSKTASSTSQAQPATYQPVSLVRLHRSNATIY
ncbi:hypothetical protein CPB83DRAFT_761302 [Crepidotus variabilis]|uniref:Uncharacterized protein n=1 Tax=Crepidotus variabilis TaxID=179855 RepID=A0A9P6ELJ7_9AGAR|nr:hypothetical protein CPB83DRAFT_761302 [Crepidotus variabilis]